MPSPVPETVAAERPRRAGSADTRLLLCIAIGQTIGWGTLFSTFALFGAPMEAELGWSRAAINAGLTLAMLVSGIAAVPIGQHVDRHGGRWMLAWGAWLGAAMLASGPSPTAWRCTGCIWLGMGLAQAAALWGPAMAVVVDLGAGAEAQHRRHHLHHRLHRHRSSSRSAPLLIAGSAGGSAAGAGGAAGDPRRARALAAAAAAAARRRRRDAAASACARRCDGRPSSDGRLPSRRMPSSASASARMPSRLLRERGWPRPRCCCSVALHGPFQVAARAALFALGRRVTCAASGGWPRC